MKVLLVVHYFTPHIGGMEAVVLKQAQSLNSKGYDVTILTCRPDKNAPISDNIGKIKIRRLKSLNFIENKFGVTFPIVSPLHIFRLIREIKKYDIVHIHDTFYMTSHIAGLAAIIRKKRYFMTQHVAIVDHPNIMVVLIQKAIYNTWGKLLFSKAARIVTYNVNVRDYLISIGIDDNKILLNYNGIDLKKFYPPTKSEKNELRAKYNLPIDKKIVLFVGRLVPKKGFDVVYNVKSSDYLTIIAGPGDIPTNMKNSRDVILFGPASQDQVCDLYKLSDVFVFPATGEIFTLAMQEAMACGLPVITTNDGGYNQYELDRQKILFVEKDSRAVKSAIESIIDNEDAKKSMSKYSRQITTDRFSWDKNYDKEYAIYNRAELKK